MTTLCIDIGNSTVAVGLHDGRQWIRHWRLSTEPQRTEDEYVLLFDGLLAAGRAGTGADERPTIDGVAIGTVVPALARPIGRMVEKLLRLTPVWVTPTTCRLVDIDIDQPSELGADLVANAVAGYQRARSSCIVVDFGTALSFTAVAAAPIATGLRPTVVGVAIAPGVGTGLAALSGNTAQLPTVPLQEPPRAIGRNTVEALQSGIVYGYAGLVEHVVQRMVSELPAPVDVWATGGFAALIAPHVAAIKHVDPWLTLDGLRLAYGGLPLF